MRRILSFMLLFSFHVGLVLSTGVEVESDSAMQVESQPSYKCIYGCKDTSFETWRQLVSHNFKTHKGKQLYVCHCGKSYKKSGPLVKHLGTHKGIYAHPCQYGCGYGGVKKYSVTVHEKTCKLRPVDAPEVFKHPCQYGCGYGAVHKGNVTLHEKTCSKRPADAPEVFRHLCQYGCGYESVQNSNVTTHEKTCSKRPADAPEVFRHPCQYDCGYGSVRKGDVTVHEKRCKLRPSGPQVIGSKRKSDDDQTGPRKRPAFKSTQNSLYRVSQRENAS